ncbi:MAG: 5-formyltetrahydrofolate cyclo-ligase, partial [Mycobacteriales bacterium]
VAISASPVPPPVPPACHSPTMETKQALRQQAQSRRSTLAPPVLDEVLFELTNGAVRVAAYVAVGSEPRVTVQRGWLLPVVTPDWDLDWGAYDGELTRRGVVEEPAGPLLGRAALASCDVVLVPALLVDRAGFRLGKGAGCYDRALPRARGLTVALLHDHELVDALPSEPHDVRVDAVATPSLGVVRFSEMM